MAILFLLCACIGPFMMALGSPWPRWLFWAAVLLLEGFIFPLAWGALVVLVVLKVMGALWRATQG